MVKRRAFLSLLLTTALTGSAMAAPATRGTLYRPAAKDPFVTAQTRQVAGPLNGLIMTIMGNRLIFAQGTTFGVAIIHIPAFGGGSQTYGISDGPEGSDPLGAKDSSLHQSGPIPVTSSSTRR